MTSPSQQEKALRRIRDGHIEHVLRTGSTEGAQMLGLPIVLLTYRGAVSGMRRMTPLMRVEHDGRYVLIASKGGDDTHPLWYRSVLADPTVHIQDGTDNHRYVAREVHGADRATWWTRATESVPNFDVYQSRTTRQIPVLVCERSEH